MKKIHSVSNNEVMIIKTQVEKTERNEEKIRGKSERGVGREPSG